MRFAILNPDAERRDGLKALLRQIDRRARFNEASDWRGADRAMQRFPTSLLVIDWHDGIRPGELRAFTTKHPDVPVAVLVDNASTPALVRELLGEGAHGVIRRTTDSPLIVKLLEVTLLGGSHVPADVLHPVAPPVPPPRRFGASARPARKPLLTSTLSPRQQQIMRCVHMGSTNKMIARTLGISEAAIFFRVTLPLATRGLLAGTLLAFARALGEFGATLMVAGNLPGRTQTLSVAIYAAVQAGDDSTANFLVLVTSVTCVVILLLAGRLVPQHTLLKSG